MKTPELYWQYKCTNCKKISESVEYVFNCEFCDSEDIDLKTTDHYNERIFKIQKTKINFSKELLLRAKEKPKTEFNYE